MFSDAARRSTLILFLTPAELNNPVVFLTLIMNNMNNIMLIVSILIRNNCTYPALVPHDKVINNLNFVPRPTSRPHDEPYAVTLAQLDIPTKTNHTIVPAATVRMTLDMAAVIIIKNLIQHA